MKKLSKIKLQDAVVLDDREMRRIFGGSGDLYCGGIGVCSGECSYWGMSGTCKLKGYLCGCAISL
jgi:natural product precursor